MARILLVTPLYVPDTVSTANLMTDLAAGLQAAGGRRQTAQITLLVMFPGFVQRLIAGYRPCNLMDMPEDSFAVQRRSERKPAQITVTLAIEGDEAEQLASAIDLSQHGLRLQTDLSLAPGQRVKLLMGGDPYYALGARVVWLGKMDSEEKGQAGLEFLKPLPTPV